VNDAIAAEESAKWTRRLAIECNNRAWRLSEAVNRSAEEDEEMLHAAHAAALHWGKVGSELNRARATMLLGHVHALRGLGSSALAYARAAFEYVVARESPPWEIAFAHAVLANAAAAAGERPLHAKHHAVARTLGAALPDAEEREMFEATFRVVPVPE
jgi:hypothetical protein